MKKIYLSIIPLLLLSSCTFLAPSTSSTSSKESVTESVSSEKSEESSTSITSQSSEVELTSTSQSSESHSSETSSEEISESTSTEESTSTSESVSSLKKIEIYASNDFHGAVEETSDQIGLIKFGTYFKKKGAEKNTLLIDQGDSWQGSIYSNYNRGHLVNDVMCEAGFDARTIGNHDFDWGLAPLKSNTARSYNGYTIPVLAANVYDYNFSTKTEGSIQQSDIGVNTVSYTLENGLKVGIVGIIGKDQITSITSTIVQDICFKEHISIIKNEATELRNSGCNVVIASAHTPHSNLVENNLENYVDLVLCGHSHDVEQTNEGDLHYAQFGSYGQCFGHITLTYDTSINDVVGTNVQQLYPSDINSELNGYVDTTIKNLVQTSNSECQPIADQVVASNVSGSFYSNSNLPNMMTKAIFDTAVKEGHSDITLAMCNNARVSLQNKSSWKYSDIYEAFPFDNEIYIIEASGNDIVKELGYSTIFACVNDTLANQETKTLNRNQKYKIAIIDYLAVHTNASRYYNYFASANGVVLDTLTNPYRTILKDWLSENGYSTGTKLNYYDFTTNTNNCFKKDITAVS